MLSGFISRLIVLGNVYKKTIPLQSFACPAYQLLDWLRRESITLQSGFLGHKLFWDIMIAGFHKIYSSN